MPGVLVQDPLVGSAMLFSEFYSMAGADSGWSLSEEPSDPFRAKPTRRVREGLSVRRPTRQCPLPPRRRGREGGPARLLELMNGIRSSRGGSTAAHSKCADVEDRDAGEAEDGVGDAAGLIGGAEG